MIWSIILIGAVCYVIWKIISKEEDAIDKLPGPKGIPILGNAGELLGRTPEEMFLIIRKYLKKYGDRFMLKVVNRKIVHISNPEDIEVVLTHPKNISKSKPYSFLKPWLGEGLLLSTGSKWFKRRKVLTPAFHFNILKNFSTIIEEKSRGLVNEVKLLGPRSEVSLMPLISNFTLHTICETAMGTQLDTDKSRESVEYKNAILKIGNTLFERLTRIWLHPNFIFRMSKQGKDFDKYLNTVHKFADNVILERKKEGRARKVGIDEEFGKKRLAMLDLLLTAEEKNEIDLEGIRDEVNTFMFEGHDTTAMAIMFGLFILAKNKDVQERMFEEYMEIFGSSDRTASTNDLVNMKYTESVIKEILRLYPSVPFIARTITEDFMLRDIPIKAGTEIAIHIYDLHRREDLYPEPELFKPERFLESVHRHPFAYIPFSAGPRNCIGQRFAMQEMKCAFSEIVRNFTLESVMDSPRLLADLVLRPVEDIKVKFISRHLVNDNKIQV